MSNNPPYMRNKDLADHSEKLGQSNRPSKFPWPERKSQESRLASDALNNILKDFEAELEDPK